jgi:hypothetical protein
MKRSQKPHTAPSAPAGDGVRIIRREPPGGRWRRWASLPVLVLAVAAACLFYRTQPQTSPAAHAAKEQRTGPAAPTAYAASRAQTAAPLRASWLSPLARYKQEPPPDDYELPSLNPDDVASYISPRDPAPTMAEVITALHNAGIYDGLGAFNPPGTSPPLQGLLVPEDFQLPEGYVRHYQVTDEGEPIEPILMFSPDFEFYDASGRPVKIPPDRVVPPELAPPGMPIVQVRIPSH